MNWSIFGTPKWKSQAWSRRKRTAPRQILVTSYEPLEDTNYDEDEIEYDDIYDELSFDNKEDEVRYH